MKRIALFFGIGLLMVFSLCVQSFAQSEPDHILVLCNEKKIGRSYNYTIRNDSVQDEDSERKFIIVRSLVDSEPGNYKFNITSFGSDFKVQFWTKDYDKNAKWKILGTAERARQGSAAGAPYWHFSKAFNHNTGTNKDGVWYYAKILTENQNPLTAVQASWYTENCNLTGKSGGSKSSTGTGSGTGSGSGGKSKKTGCNWVDIGALGTPYLICQCNGKNADDSKCGPKP